MKFLKTLSLLILVTSPRPLAAQEALDATDNLISGRSAVLERMQNGFLTDAISLSETCLKTAEARFGATHPSLVPYLTDLATLQRVLGRYEEAESTLKWGLAIREKKLEAENPLTADSLSQLASLYNDWGRWDEALYFGKRALAVQEKIGGSEGLITALSLLGDIQSNLHHHLEAQNLLKRALALQEKTSRNPTRTVLLLSALSKAYSAGSRSGDAEASLKKALAHAQKNFRPDSVEIADAAEGLADFYLSISQPEKSKPLYESALQTYKSYVGVYYGYSVLPYLQRLAKAYQTVGEYPAAKDLLEKALAASRTSFGSNHPLVAVTLIRLAQAEEGMGEKKAMAAHRKEALGILKSRFAGDHPLIHQVEASLAK